MPGRDKVGEVREGRNSLQGIGKEVGEYILVLDDLSWDEISEQMGWEPADLVHARSLEVYLLDQQLDQLPPCDSIIGIGTKLAIEAAKYFAWKKEAKFICIPGSLDTDAFARPSIEIWQNSIPQYLGKIYADTLILDYDLLRNVPDEVNISGAAHLLAVHTACFDWEYAKKQGKSRVIYSHKAVDEARKMLDDFSYSLSDLRICNDKGLRALAEGYLKLQEICTETENTRVRVGSEHYFKLELAERLQRPLDDGGTLALGIFLMARLQNNKPEQVISMLDELGLDFQPMNLDVSAAHLGASLMDLRYFVERKQGLFYTCINDSNMDEEWAFEMMQGLIF